MTIQEKRPSNLINKWQLRIKLHEMSKYIDRLFVCVRIFSEFISNPVFLGIISLFQLASGALLGANISLAFPTDEYDNYDSLQLMEKLWDGMHPVTLYCFLIAVSFTLVRALSDTYLSIIRQNQEEQRIQELKSLPESLWLKNYYSSYLPQSMQIHNEITTVFDSGIFNDEYIISSITNLLVIFKEMAASWDSGSIEDYSTNLMIYAPISSQIKKSISKHWERNSIFFDGYSPESVSSQISGILYVAGSSNSTTKFYTGDEKNNNSPLILPVCLERNDSVNLTRQALPGAPEAIKSGSYYYMADILISVTKWLTEDYWRHFTDDQAEKIYEYYREDHSGRSLISIPIKLPTKVEHVDTSVKLDKNAIIGVLNIYSTQKNMLRANPRDFNEFCRPLLSSLALCITAYDIWTRLPNETEIQE